MASVPTSRTAIPRNALVDGLRGYFLVFMLINHLVFVGGYWLIAVNHNQLSFVEDAQGFVFLSGLLVGLVFARRMASADPAAGARRIWARAFELYRYAIGTIIVILAARAVLPEAAQIWFNWLGNTRLDDPLRMAAVLTLLFQPTYMDILPQYIIYMLVAPPVIQLCVEGRWAYVALASFLLWVAGQLGLARLVTDPVNGWIMGGDGQGMRVSFNLLGWQIVFFSGLVIGTLTSTGQLNWSRICRPEATLLPKLCLLVCLFFLPLRIATAHDLLPQAVMEKFATMEVRADFGPVYLICFGAAAFGLTWLLIAGPLHGNARVRRLAVMLRGLFSLGFLRLLGRHSLYVYVWHVAIVYFVFYVDQRTPVFSQLTKTFIALVCVMLLALPALWRERDRFLGGPPPAVALS